MKVSSLRSGWAARMGWAAAVFLPTALLVMLAFWPPEGRHEAGIPTIEAPATAPIWRDILAAPIVRPDVVGAKEARLLPEEKVIGIVVSGRARAYRVGAMEHRSGHLINDVIGDVPTSVAYCDRSGCARAYTGPAGSGPLSLAVAGLLDDRMVLNVRGVPYFHDTGRRVDPALLESSRDPVANASARRAREASQLGRGATLVPYATLSPELTTWRAWVQQHPESDVYTD